MTLPPLAAEKMFQIGSLPVTNSYINSTIALVFFLIFSLIIRRSIKKYYRTGQHKFQPVSDGNRNGETTINKADQDIAPRGILNFFESILEVLLGYIDNVTKDRQKTLKFLPIVGSLFLFILVSNWLGLLPGTGSIGFYQLHEGRTELIPLLRPANADLNMTLSMAALAVISAHIAGIMTIGFFRYVNKFIKLGDIVGALKTLNPLKILTAVIEFFVGLIEVFSEAAKVVSLSLRLFGNIFAGEVLLTVLAGLVAFVAPLPFMALELLVGFIQAVVFSMLTLVYLVIATTEVHNDHAGT